MYTSIAFKMGATQEVATRSLGQVHSFVSDHFDRLQDSISATPALVGIELGQQALRHAERNIGSAFDFAQSLMLARDVQDVLTIQAEYFQRQMKVLTDQIGSLGETAVGAVVRQGRAGPLGFGF
ncbi:MAG: phasin family protein [Rhodoplanes sp.]|uniref:phasin family protein n=1 Tax=Rhodoplanes sp. TaxID=1968906 RepID=UPI0018098305|nr:phasin family protein [Rhodoplanes sp.]NVO17656.1 phasin family protein [Rhodoplanes sp.]